MAQSFILAGCRTPIGRLLGSLSAVPATDLGARCVAQALARTGLPPDQVEEVILGNILSAGLGQAPARQAALAAGIPPTVSALTINKMCGSGLKAVMLADQAIRAGDAHCMVAGGMESMSRAPHLLMGARAGWKFGNQTVLDSMLHDGLWCPFEDALMGESADYIAAKCNVSRADQDAFALASHRRALAAHEAGKFKAEIVPIDVPGRRGSTQVTADEGPRPDSSAAGLAQLKPAFGPEGTVTAGNSSQLSDGAAAVVVASGEVAASVESPIKARIVSIATSGVEPKDIFIAPVTAMERAVKKARMTFDSIDLIELNEAFAAQCLACARPLKLDLEKLNVHGGAIALGHPIGASGARTLVTLLHALADRNLSTGLVSLCLGGGNAVAMVVSME